jgi:hypothetical protein
VKAKRLGGITQLSTVTPKRTTGRASSGTPRETDWEMLEGIANAVAALVIVILACVFLALVPWGKL